MVVVVVIWWRLLAVYSPTHKSLKSLTLFIQNLKANKTVKDLAAMFFSTKLNQRKWDSCWLSANYSRFQGIHSYL